jgi:multidrug efflux pump subunit AcrB
MERIARLFLILSIIVSAIAAITFVPAISGVVVENYKHAQSSPAGLIIALYFIMVGGLWFVTLILYNLKAEKKRTAKSAKKGDQWDLMVQAESTKRRR